MDQLLSMTTMSSFDIIMLGSSGVGKSSITTRSLDANASFPPVTVGVEYTVKTITLPQSYIKLCICDCSGQDRFMHLLRSYYLNCQGAIIVYDIQNRESFEKAKDWVIELREQVSPDMVIAFTGNKADLEANRTVSEKEADEYAKDFNLIYI
ncbi:ras-related protein Rab-5A-like [Drosophila innubila]|uniref:ras-related protein Rab-5A-like n=1 Tax=Drosophila innubila TaxID=198719 RepID=UPI00148CADE4|nr:ras-related protein Rab-5A-like [Drosophila innubila]